MIKPEIRFEALNDRLDRTSFGCGIKALDVYFQAQATQDIRRRMSNCFVALHGEAEEIAGFYTLSVASIPFVDLPPAESKRLPRYPALPAVRIGRLAIDARFQGQPPEPEWRYSRQIMGHLIAEGQRIAREWPGDGERPGWMVLMVRRDNARAIRFYERCGFELIPGVVRRNDHVVMKLWVGDIEKQ